MVNVIKLPLALAAVLAVAAGCTSDNAAGSSFPTSTVVTTLGAGLGAVAGGAAGSLIGSGTGRTLATAGGAVGGGALGGATANTLYTPSAVASSQVPRQPQSYSAPTSEPYSAYSPAQVGTTYEPSALTIPEPVYIKPASVAVLETAPIYQVSQDTVLPSTYVPSESYVITDAPTYAQPDYQTVLSTY